MLSAWPGLTHKHINLKESSINSSHISSRPRLVVRLGHISGYMGFILEANDWHTTDQILTVYHPIPKHTKWLVAHSQTSVKPRSSSTRRSYFKGHTHLSDLDDSSNICTHWVATLKPCRWSVSMILQMLSMQITMPWQTNELVYWFLKVNTTKHFKEYHGGTEPKSRLGL